MPTSAGPNGSTISISFPGEGNSAERAADGAAVPQHRNPMALPGAAELGIAIGSGGTEGVLPAERAKATFDVEAMTNILDGGRAYTTKRRWIFGAHEGADVFVHAEMNRADLIAHGMGHFMDVHAKHLANEYRPKDLDMSFMSDARMTTGPIAVNFGIFASCLSSNSSDEQRAWWVPAARAGRIIGCYAQTELSHGSNVRGLQTSATYDAAAREWVLHTPSIGAVKWWSTGMPAATHAAVFAQARTPATTFAVDGRYDEHGLQIFLVQLRGADLKLLPGVEVGDVGTLLGDNDTPVGYLRMTNLRLPRRHMLERRQHVTPEGRWAVGPPPGSMKQKQQQQQEQQQQQQLSPAAPPAASASAAGAGAAGQPAMKQGGAQFAQVMKYITMLKVRLALSSTAGGALAKACVIAARYSCVRHQGFADTRAGQAHTAPERQIADYSVQRFRVCKQIATAYALKSATQWAVLRRKEVEASTKVGAGGGQDEAALMRELPELHATSAGLKALGCVLAADGIEDLRRSCGGHGYLMCSGIAPLEADFKGPNTTAEGDYVLLLLQTARFLVKSLAGARTQGKQLGGIAEYLAPLAAASSSSSSSSSSFDAVRDGRAAVGLPPPRTAGAAGENPFLQPDFVIKLLRYRALVAVGRCADALAAEQAANPGEGGGFDAAWNKCARQLYTTAASHVRYFIMAKFGAVVGAVADGPCQSVLGSLCCLYGVSDVLQGEQWLGLISADEAELAEHAAQQLCARLRPDIVPLTDAFDFPDRVLNSALGRHDGNVYEQLFLEAKRSALNMTPDGKTIEVPSYIKVMEPYLDFDLLGDANTRTPAASKL